MHNKIVFLDIDTQYDFMNPRGGLYVPRAEKLIPNLRRLFRFAVEKNIPVISTLDTHRRDDPEFKYFPPHCVKGTRGYKKISQTLTRPASPILPRGRRGAGKSKQIFVIKHTIDIFSNPRIKVLLKPYRTAYVFGVALDYCVKAACLGLVKLNISTYLVSDATQAVSAKEKTETLRLLRKKGVIPVRTGEVIQGLSKVRF